MEFAIGTVRELYPVATIIADYAEPPWFEMMQHLRELTVCIEKDSMCRHEHDVTHVIFRTPVTPNFENLNVELQRYRRMTTTNGYGNVSFAQIEHVLRMMMICPCKTQTVVAQCSTAIRVAWGRQFR